jgi:drug/metabolite transporter (DMT)-like permease
MAKAALDKSRHHSSGLRGPVLAAGAALTFALSVPLGKLLLGEMGSFTVAGILYLGAGLGLTVYRLATREPARTVTEEESSSPGPSSRRSRLCLAGAIVCGGIIAPGLLFWGLTSLAAASASLLLSLEVVFTALLAALLFREEVAKRVWMAIGLMVVASALLALTGGSRAWSLSAIAVAIATFFWGLDNNLTREVRGYSAAFIAQLKGLVAGTVNLLIGVLALGQVPKALPAIAGAAIGAVSYGLSLVLFVFALRSLGSARTGTYFSSAPVLAAIFSLLIFPEPPGWELAVALVLVIAATILMATERHIHEHRHGELVHTHGHWPDQEHRHAH